MTNHTASGIMRAMIPDAFLFQSPSDASASDTFSEPREITAAQGKISDADIFQCVPNFSEGRRPEVVAALEQAVRDTPGVRLVNASADGDHNRCVLTFLGTAEPIRAACVAAARVAIALIDLRTHTGVHPRVGALDVLPVVPLWGASRGQAVKTAHAIGFALAEELALPVYFYEWAARPARPTALPVLRAGGFERLAGTPLVGELAPDAGPPHVHPTAGIAIVGARGPLVAVNFNLDTPDVAVARAVARRIRQKRDHIPELMGVRALGLLLASQNRAQISLNLTQPDRTPLPTVFAWVREELKSYHADIVETEIIGVIPQTALAGQAPETIRWMRYDPAQVLPKTKEDKLVRETSRE